VSRARKDKYPREVYVRRELDPNGPSFLIVEEDLEKVAAPGEEIEIAVYELVRYAKVTAPVLIVNAGRAFSRKVKS
jgi:hypothetical protein